MDHREEAATLIEITTATIQATQTELVGEATSWVSEGAEEIENSPLDLEEEPEAVVEDISKEVTTKQATTREPQKLALTTLEEEAEASESTDPSLTITSPEITLRLIINEVPC